MKEHAVLNSELSLRRFIFLNNDSESKNKSKFYKVFIGAIILIFFSGVAVLSLLLDKKDDVWVLDEAKSKNEQEVGGNTSGLSLTSNFEGTTNLSGNMGTSNTLGTSDSNQQQKFPVYIVGEVKKPGIYLIAKGTFLYQLVEMAGGLSSNAARNSINLAFLIPGNQMIKIPSIKDVSSGNIGGTSEQIIIAKENGFEATSSSANNATAKVNINTATSEQLETLPGVGAATSQMIIDYRTKNGGFKIIQDIMKISGIKESKYNQIKDRITVG